MQLGAAQSVERIMRNPEPHAMMARMDVWALTHWDGSMRSEWWPRGSSFIGDPALDVGLMESVWWGQPELTSGAQSRFGITGVTRDAYGSPLGGCVVQLFRTTTDEIVAEVTSDPAGTYLITTPYYPDQHYIVAYRAGTPDVAGTTVNTLVAA